MKNDHKDFVAACLERSQPLPLTVYLDLKHGDYHEYPDCTCVRNDLSPGMQINPDNPCRYHTTIDPLFDVDHVQRIHKLDVHLDMLDGSEEGPNQDFSDALDDFEFFALRLPSLESLSFSVDHELDVDTHLNLPGSFFSWGSFPPTRLRHLTLHGCYGGPIRAVRNLTSFELAGVGAFDPIELTERSFLPFISGSPSLVSLTLSNCSFPDPEKLLKITPVKLPKLKTLRLIRVYGLPGLPSLIGVPALKTLSSLHISTARKQHYLQSLSVHIQVRAESDDGFQLSYDTTDYKLVSDWLAVTQDANPGPAFVRFEGQGLDDGEGPGMEVSQLPLFVNAKVLEIGASFAGTWYPNSWEGIENVGPQLTTLRLEVIEGMDPVVARSVKKFVEARSKKGMPLTKLERMEFKEMNEENEEKAKRLWEVFRAGLDIDQYLAL